MRIESRKQLTRCRIDGNSRRGSQFKWRFDREAGDFGEGEGRRGRSSEMATWKQVLVLGTVLKTRVRRGGHRGKLSGIWQRV